MAPQHVLVTGGLGYIGSHTVLALLDFYAVSIVDNLDNASLACFDRLKQLTGDNGSRLFFHKVDVMDAEALERVFAGRSIDAVVHFAAKKSVAESNVNPLRYYSHNVSGLVTLLKVMAKFGVYRIVCSSSACVYGTAEHMPVDEAAPLGVLNPYGRTKLIMEDIMADVAKSDARWRVLLLRYFNPAGAHPSGEIGEHVLTSPNLVSTITQAVLGLRPCLQVFGTDYATRDGTAVRDYVHVVDVARGHHSALQLVFSKSAPSCRAYNLGTGTGCTVMEMIDAFEKASGKKVPWEAAPRRQGDAEAVYATTKLAEQEMGWRAELGLEDMCRDHWAWITANPNGYPEAAPLESEREEVAAITEQMLTLRAADA